MDNYSKIVEQAKANSEEQKRKASAQLEQQMDDFLTDSRTLFKRELSSMENVIQHSVRVYKKSFRIATSSLTIAVVIFLGLCLLLGPMVRGQVEILTRQTAEILKNQGTLKEANLAGLEVFQENGIHYVTLPSNRKFTGPVEAEDGTKYYKVIGD